MIISLDANIKPLRGPKMMDVFYVFGNSDIYHSHRHLNSEAASVLLRQDLADKRPCDECVRMGWLEV
jgi:hypothetical protein